MRSDLQIEASRANGSKSRGPISEEGKHASSRNALKHGILSDTVLLPGEDPASFEADAQDLFEEHKPIGHTEQEMVEMMIVARWRRTRVWMIEKTCMAGQLMREYHQAQEPKPGLTTATALAFRTMADNSRTLDLISRYESRYDRQYFRAHRRLLETQDRRMRSEPDNTPPPAPGPLSVLPTVLPSVPTDFSPATPIDPGASAGNCSFAKRTQAYAGDVENTAPSVPSGRRPFYLTEIFEPEAPDSAIFFHAAAGIHPS
jgi:hypothetical protein